VDPKPRRAVSKRLRGVRPRRGRGHRRALVPPRPHAHGRCRLDLRDASPPEAPRQGEDPCTARKEAERSGSVGRGLNRTARARGRRRGGRLRRGGRRHACWQRRRCPADRRSVCIGKAQHAVVGNDLHAAIAGPSHLGAACARAGSDAAKAAGTIQRRRACLARVIARVRRRNVCMHRCRKCGEERR
jgi:hypothetical protein